MWGVISVIGACLFFFGIWLLTQKHIILGALLMMIGGSLYDNASRAIYPF